MAAEDLLAYPQDRSLTNRAGTFRLEVVAENGWLTVTRSLEIVADAVPAEAWRDLRALLLAESDPANRTVIWRRSGSE